MSRTETQGAADAPWQEPKKLAAALAANGWSNRRTADAFGCGETTIRNWRNKHGIEGPKNTGAAGPRRGQAEPARFERDGDEARVVLEAGVELGDIETLLSGRGLNPAEWEIDRVKVNEWEAYAGRNEPFGEPEIVTLQQLTVHLRKRRTWDFVVAGVAPKVPALPKTSPRVRGRARVEFVGGDQQAIYHDKALHRAVCLWLRDVQPDGINMTGDTVDFPTISRHADRPHWNATPQECINAGVQVLFDYACAAPDAVRRKLRGNHDWRVESEMLTRAERLFGLRPGLLPGETADVPLYSIRRLLRLDEFGYELFGREGDKWELAEIPLADDLVVMHKPPSKERMTRLGRDVVAGDSHRQRIEHVTTYVDGQPIVRTLMQVGLLAEASGLGYTSDPDWQQGFGTVTLWPDGTRAFELAQWNGRALTWRGEKWKP